MLRFKHQPLYLKIALFFYPSNLNCMIFNIFLNCSRTRNKTHIMILTHPNFICHCLTTISLLAVNRKHKTVCHEHFVCQSDDNQSSEGGDKIQQRYVSSTGLVRRVSLFIKTLFLMLQKDEVGKARREILGNFLIYVSDSEFFGQQNLGVKL